MTRTSFAFTLQRLARTPLADGVAEGDKGYIQEISSTHLLPFTYLGAKHMVTGGVGVGLFPLCIRTMTIVSCHPIRTLPKSALRCPWWIA